MGALGMGVKRVLVTGAAGFTGRHACLRLAASGWEVVAVVSGRHASAAGEGAAAEGNTGEIAGGGPRLPAPAPVPIPGAARTVSCDLTDREAVRAMWRETAPDALLHLAGQNAVDRSWREPDLTLAANVLSTVYLLEAMRAGGGGDRALIVGSMLRETADRSSHPYAYSKSVQASAALAWHRWYGLAVVVAEPSNLIGPGGSAGLCGRIARWAAESEAAERAGSGDAANPAAGQRPAPFRLSSLTEQRDFLDVRDGAAAYELLLRAGTPGAVYAIESGAMRSLRDVKETFERLSPAALHWEIGERGAAAPSPEPRDCSPIRSLGWAPSVPFADSVADALKAERARLGLTLE